MLRLLILLGVSALLALADGPVLQTGQVKSYDGDGNVVTDGSIKDDGYYQTGVMRSYSRSSIGIVTDHTTGLEWQDDVRSVEKRWLTKENYDAKDYHDTSGDTAIAYCNGLSLDGGGWRLPSIEELRTILDYGEHQPTLTKDIFHGVINTTFYWSSTDSSDNEDAALVINFGAGMLNNIPKNTTLAVRCVRKNGHLVPSNLSRNNETDIVTDSTTGLQWQDDSDVRVLTKNWTAAIFWCEDYVTLGGYDFSF